MVGSGIRPNQASLCALLRKQTQNHGPESFSTPDDAPRPTRLAAPGRSDPRSTRLC